VIKEKILIRITTIYNKNETIEFGPLPEFFKKSLFSEAEKHPDFQVTLCLNLSSHLSNLIFVVSDIDSCFIQRWL